MYYDDMKKLPMSIFLPEDLVRDLRSYVPKRKISEFIARSIEEKLKTKKAQMAKDLITASSDNMRIKECESWDTLLEDGLNEENQY